MQEASELGASRSLLQEAIEVTQKVQENAARIHGREAERLLETSAAPQAPSADDDGACADDCPCHADEDEAAAAGIESETCATEATSEQSQPAVTPTSNRPARPARPTASVADPAEEADAAGPFKEMGRCCAMHGS